MSVKNSKPQVNGCKISRREMEFKKLCRESSSLNLETVNQFRDSTLVKFMNEYNEANIFNDETDLFYKLLPEEFLVFKKEACSGKKQAKQ